MVGALAFRTAGQTTEPSFTSRAVEWEEPTASEVGRWCYQGMLSVDGRGVSGTYHLSLMPRKRGTFQLSVVPPDAAPEVLATAGASFSASINGFSDVALECIARFRGNKRFAVFSIPQLL